MYKNAPPNRDQLCIILLRYIFGVVFPSVIIFETFTLEFSPRGVQKRAARERLFRTPMTRAIFPPKLDSSCLHRSRLIFFRLVHVVGTIELFLIGNGENLFLNTSLGSAIALPVLAPINHLV